MSAPAGEILIAGGGIGGLAAALALARVGRRVRVLEKAHEFAESGYGIQLGPNAYRVLDELGVRAAIDRSAVYPEAIVLVDAVIDREINRLALDEAFRHRYGAPYIVIHRGDLLAALLDGCRAHAGITLESDCDVTAFEDARDRVAVRCGSGRTVAGAALVGADGLHSVVRAGLLADGPPRPLGHVAYRGVVPMTRIDSRARRNAVVGYVGPGLHLVQYPLRGGAELNNVAVIVSERFAAGIDDYGGSDELDARFGAVADSVRAHLYYVSRERRWPLFDRAPVAAWSRGNVTLLGDAAHPTVQYLAQGACMALEDAVVLGRAVRDAAGLPAAFRAYERERAPRTARVQWNARGFGDLCHAEGGARTARNGLWSAAEAARAERFDWLYRGPDLRRPA
jgi:salicylate hydroxylase